MSTNTGEPRSGRTATAQAVPGGLISMTHQEMDSARDCGEVEPLAAGVTWLARYADARWIAYERRWLLVSDEHLRADLDRVSSRLASAESATIRLTILRQSLGILRDINE